LVDDQDREPLKIDHPQRREQTLTGWGDLHPAFGRAEEERFVAGVKIVGFGVNGEIFPEQQTPKVDAPSPCPFPPPRRRERGGKTLGRGPLT